MCTERQIQANRANALRSTGPRTTTGKQKSSQNAVRHGLLSSSGQILITGEDPTEYEDFCSNLREDLKPVGQLETLLAERITGFFWKLGRTGRMEKGLLDILCNPPTEKDTSKTNIKSQFMMIMTKQYKTPSEDPEFQEFKKHKEQQAAAINYTSDEGDLLEPETVEELTEIQKESISNSSTSADNASAQTLGRAVQYDFQNNSLLERLLKYEGQIERSLYKAMSQLQKLQYVRRSNKNLDSDMNIEEKSNEANLPETAAQSPDSRADKHTNKANLDKTEPARKPDNPPVPPHSVEAAAGHTNKANLEKTECAAKNPNNNPVSSRSIEVAAGHLPQAPKTEELDHSLCPTHMVRRFVCGCRDESKIPKTADSICPRHAVRFRVCGCSYEPKVPKDGKSICPHHAVRYSLCGCK